MPSGTQEDGSFALFPNLPTELRLQVWRACLETASLDEQLCVFQARGHFNPNREEWENGTWSHNPLGCQPVRARLGRVCREAREATLAVPFDLGTVIHYVSDDAHASFIQTFRHGDPTERAHEIRHLAIASGAANSNLNWALSRMPNLETLCVVFPQAQGKINRDTPVYVPIRERENVRLVEIPTILRDQTQFVASPNFSGWFGDLRSSSATSRQEDSRNGWARSITEYLQIVRNAIRRRSIVPSTDPQGAYGIPAVWDRERRILNLNIEARYFVWDE